MSESSDPHEAGSELLNLGAPIMHLRPNFTLEPGEIIELAFFFSEGGWVRPEVKVEVVREHDQGAHLEWFSGVEVTDPVSEDAWRPGAQIAGVRNRHYGYLFLVEVDRERIAHPKIFYSSL